LHTFYSRKEWQVAEVNDHRLVLKYAVHAMDASPQLPARSLLQMADDDERYAVDDEEDQGDQAEEVTKTAVVSLPDPGICTRACGITDSSKGKARFGVSSRRAVPATP
jgi:hypothetical protein